MFQPLGEYDSLGDVECLCLGAGRFLRAVLVPAIHGRVIICETRGTDFVDALYQSPEPTYEVETVMPDGSTKIAVIPVAAAGSLGRPEEKQKLIDLCMSTLRRVRVIGFGVTEAGVAEDSPVINDLASVLFAFASGAHPHHLSVINTDNIPGNGDKIGNFIRACSFIKELHQSNSASAVAFLDFMKEHTTFHNTMVDRITSHRENDPLTPRSEPLPRKTLVIEDIHNVLPDVLDRSDSLGVIVRTREGDIATDYMLKLRVANATHSALVYAMVLNRCGDTRGCATESIYVEFIDKLVAYDIGILSSEGVAEDTLREVYADWRTRLLHPFFGLSTMFICQNALQKLSIRLLPTVYACLRRYILPSPFMSFAIASLLRFLTPWGHQQREAGVYVGQMNTCHPTHAPLVTHEYAGALKANFAEGWYEYLEGGLWPKAVMEVPELQQIISAESNQTLSSRAVERIIARSLSPTPRPSLDGPAEALFREFVSSVASMYAALVNGKPVTTLLKELLLLGCARDPLLGEHFSADLDGRFLNADQLKAAVLEEVNTVEVIDLHTHLFPPSHSSLIKFGFDSLLTYHYLVAEFFMTVAADEQMNSYAIAQPISTEYFFTLPIRIQADLVWEHLFVRRSPLSEAARGVCTTLKELGLGDALKRRDVAAIRRFFDALDPDEYVETIFRTARVKYCVMTNIPFDEREAAYFRPTKMPHSRRFRTALRVDPLLKNDWALISRCLSASGYEDSIEGAINYLVDWVDTMQPEYLMASTPGNFSLDPLVSQMNLLEQVLVPIAERCNLALVLKVEADRGWNPSLRDGGDGVRELDPRVLQQLCTRYPRIKFLTTFLSRANQHSACVLANKFSNMHLYGCWWYCNNPSIISEITKMRLEMLGTAFTVQHSDARVLDQLVYKWKHSREVIGRVLLEQYTGLLEAGWGITREEIVRDVHRLFGGAYEEFMAKKLP